MERKKQHLLSTMTKQNQAENKRWLDCIETIKAFFFFSHFCCIYEFYWVRDNEKTVLSPLSLSRKIFRMIKNTLPLSSGIKSSIKVNRMDFDWREILKRDFWIRIPTSFFGLQAVRMAEWSKALRFRSQSSSEGVGSNPTSDNVSFFSLFKCWQVCLF